MENRRNYYRILHIQPDAPDAIIRASYRTQMQKLRMHPDLGGDEWNASLLNEAYQVLSDPERRRAYDRTYFNDGNRPAPPVRSSAEKKRPRNTGKPFADRYVSDPATCPFCGTMKPAVSTRFGPGDCTGCGAPLESANTLRPVGTSKRATDRISRREVISVYETPGGDEQHAVMCNLSPNGMQLQCTAPLRVNQVILIACQALSATGRVTFCNRTTCGSRFVAGIEFLTLRFNERSGTFLSVSA